MMHCAGCGGRSGHGGAAVRRGSQGGPALCACGALAKIGFGSTAAHPAIRLVPFTGEQAFVDSRYAWSSA